MTSTKRRKFDNDNRAFKEESIEKYAFILPTSSSNPYCLIYSHNAALVKSRNLKRHYETKHGGFEENVSKERKKGRNE